MTFMELCDKLAFTSDDMEQFAKENDISILKYLSLKTKYSYAKLINLELNKFINGFNLEELDVNAVYMRYDVLVALMGVLEYTNIEAPDEFVTEPVYNLLLESGYLDYIIDQIGELEYRRFCDVCDRVTDIKNIKLENLFITGLDTENAVAATKEMIRMLNEDLDADKLTKVEELLQLNSPLNKKIADTMAKMSIVEVLQGVKGEQVDQVENG